MASITAAGENAIHVAIELSQSTWLIAARLPNANKSHLFRIPGGEASALLKLLQWFASCSWRNQPVSQQSALLMAPIGTVAPNLIGRRYKKVKKAAERFDELTPQQRHEFRIAVKKLRYTIEFLKDLFDSTHVAGFVQRLKPLQDDAGYANDIRVAHELLIDLQASRDAVPLARAAGIVLGWHDRGLADLDRKLRKHIHRLRQLRPFW